jgi:hypothetical protein
MKNANDSARGLRVRSGVKGCGISPQHNRRGLKVNSGVKSGGLSPQHNRRPLRAG